MDALVRVRLPASDKKEIEAAARRMRISVSSWIRIAALEKLERDKTKGEVGRR